METLRVPSPARPQHEQASERRLLSRGEGFDQGQLAGLDAGFLGSRRWRKAWFQKWRLVCGRGDGAGGLMT